MIHLPECFYFLDDFGDGERCICDRVRTREQRVLDAAREAVAETQRWHEFSWGMDDDEDGEYVKTEEALAAIDALRGDP